MPKTGNRDLKNHAYQIIKERLINCIYEPGSFINESQLATDLGLSRSVKPSTDWNRKGL